MQNRLQEIAKVEQERNTLETRVGNLDQRGRGPAQPADDLDGAGPTSSTSDPIGVNWVKRHRDVDGSVLVSARVVKAGEGDYEVALLTRGIALQPGKSDSCTTRRVAFEIGDSLVRIQLLHVCGSSCSKWIIER